MAFFSSAAGRSSARTMRTIYVGSVPERPATPFVGVRGVDEQLGAILGEDTIGVGSRGLLEISSNAPKEERETQKKVQEERGVVMTIGTGKPHREDRLESYEHGREARNALKELKSDYDESQRSSWGILPYVSDLQEYPEFRSGKSSFGEGFSVVRHDVESRDGRQYHLDKHIHTTLVSKRPDKLRTLLTRTLYVLRRVVSQAHGNVADAQAGVEEYDPSGQLSDSLMRMDLTGATDPLASVASTSQPVAFHSGAAQAYPPTTESPYHGGTAEQHADESQDQAGASPTMPTYMAKSPWYGEPWGQ